MEAGVSPWKLHEAPTALYTSSQSGRGTYDYDYSDSMDRIDSHLRNVVYDVLSKTHPGTLVQAEFRLCASPPPQGSANEAVHDIPQLEEGPLGPPVQLARTLRPDQRSALRFVVDSESHPKTQRCLFKAFVRMNPPPLAVGGLARLKPSFCPNMLSSEMKGEFNKQNIERLQQVLALPGLVTAITEPERGDRAVVTVGWTFADGGSFSLTLAHCRLEAASIPGKLSPGGHVRLLRPDAAHCISVEDVGTLTQHGVDNSVEVCFPQCFCWRGHVSDVEVTSEDLAKPCAEVRISVEYKICGSICGQKMGWGKTPLMVALIKHASQEAAAQQRRSTSLVIVPPKLFRQWVNEFRAWLGMPAGTNAWMTTPDGSLTIWAPVDMKAFKDQDPEVAATADVVVLPHTIFASKKYPSESEPWPQHVFNVLSRTWSRLILDEVHEISCLTREIQRHMLAVRSEAVHALSGTPEQGGGSRGAASLALAFKASLCPMLGAHFCFDADEDVTLAAAEFFRTCACTQASPFRLPVTEHTVSVRLSDAEQVLYANLKMHGSPSTRELLELCCCFVSKTSSSANKEIGVLIKQKKKELKVLLDAAKGHAAFAVLLSKCVAEEARLASRRKALKCKDARREFWEEGRRLVDKLFEGLSGMGCEELASFVQDYHVNGLKSRELVGEVGHFSERIRRLHTGQCPRAEAKEAFNEQLDNHLARDFGPLGAVKKPLDFLQRSMEELLGGGGSCPICLDGLENGEATCMTSCGHAFHEECMSDVLKSRRECPNCRQHVRQVYDTKPQVPMDPWLKYGTKVKEMIRKLKDIMRDYPGERLLLFVQYRDMRKNLEKAFQEFEVPFLTLSGGARTQGNAITRWQSGRDPDDFLMMLSCEEHNSGITLTRARPGRRRSLMRLTFGVLTFVYFLGIPLQAHHAGPPLRRAVPQGGRGHGTTGAGAHQPHRAGGHFPCAMARRDGGHHRAGAA